jgi:hypothetical protein
MTSGFNSPENKKLLYELSLDLLKNRYNFAKLGTTVVQQVQHQLSDFLDQQHTLIYKNRFNYIDGGVKAMNKDMLRGANDFLYHLYKQYKSKPMSHMQNIPAQTPQTPELKMVYERPTTFKANEDTQTYKQERQSSLEQVMREKQNDLQSYFSKPTKEIDFADKEDDRMKPDELDALLKQRQQEDSSLHVQHPQLSDLSGGNSIPKKVSFGTASIRPFDDSEPSENVKSNQPKKTNEQPTTSNFLSRLKPQGQQLQQLQEPLGSSTNSANLYRPSSGLTKTPQPSQSQQSQSYITKPATFIKRLCLILSTTNISHHFLRLRGERTTQTPSQQQTNLIQTILENLPVELTTPQHTHFKEFLNQHHSTIWRWWEFLEDIKRQGTAKQTNWWFDYFDIDNPYLDTFPRELREWLTQPIRLPKK